MNFCPLILLLHNRDHNCIDTLIHHTVIGLFDNLISMTFKLSATLQVKFWFSIYFFINPDYSIHSQLKDKLYKSPISSPKERSVNPK